MDIRKVCQKNIERLLARTTMDFKSAPSDSGFGCSAILFLIGMGSYYGVINFFPTLKDLASIVIIAFLLFLVFLVFHTKKRSDDKVSYKNRIKSLGLAKEHLEKVLSILDSEHDFFLYLRDFRTGEQVNTFPHYTGGGGTGIAHPNNWNRTYGNEKTVKILSYFSQIDIPVIMLNNIKERTHIDEKNALIFYPPDDIWIDCIKAFISKSKYILIDFNFKKLTKSIKIEIDCMVKHGKKNLIFIGSNQDLKLMQNQHKDLYDLIIHSIIYKKHISTENWQGTGKKDTNLFDFNFGNLLEKLG